MKIDKFIDDSLMFTIIKSSEFIRRDIIQSLNVEKINFYQSLILVSLYAEKETLLRPGDFIYAFDLPKAVISQSLTKLEELKLIKRFIDEQDARKNLVKLTSLGKKKAVSVMNILQKLDSKFEKTFSKKEIKSNLHFLKCLSNRNLN